MYKKDNNQQYCFEKSNMNLACGRAGVNSESSFGGNADYFSRPGRIQYSKKKAKENMRRYFSTKI